MRFHPTSIVHLPGFYVLQVLPDIHWQLELATHYRPNPPWGLQSQCQAPPRLALSILPTLVPSLHQYRSAHHRTHTQPLPQDIHCTPVIHTQVFSYKLHRLVGTSHFDTEKTLQNNLSISTPWSFNKTVNEFRILIIISK